MVIGPQLLKTEMWKRSGHFENYRENMYFTEVEGQSYGIKPMNCLAHMLIYKSTIRSYRDLPIRYFEMGLVHRHEKSGVLHGLTRVRQFTQDDAYLLCTPEQLNDEILNQLQSAMNEKSLVSSGTTAKQLDRETHARPIGYGAMIAEGFIALVWAGAAQGFYGSTTALGAALDIGGPGQVVHEVCTTTMGAFGGVLAVLGVVVLVVSLVRERVFGLKLDRYSREVKR